MTSDISSTQTIVTFLTMDSSSVYTEAQRVFDFEISNDALNFYTGITTTLQKATEGYTWDAGSSSWVEEADTSKLIQIIQSLVSKLDEWSQMKEVVNGEQIDNSPLSLLIPGDFIYGYTQEVVGQSTLELDSTMNRYMAESLDQIVRTLRSAGWDPVAQPIWGDPAAFALAWQAFANITGNAANGGDVNGKEIYDMEGVMSSALNVINSAVTLEDASTQSESLQQLLMVDYIARGNEMLYEEMSDLNAAININQEILSYLNSLQDLMNQKDPEHFLMQLQYLSGTTDDTSWQTFEEETFNQDLGTETKLPGFSSEEIAAYVTMISGTNYTYEEGTGIPLDPETGEPLINYEGEAGGAFVGTQFLETGAFVFNAQWEQITENLQSYIDELAVVSGDENTALSSQLKKIIDDFNMLAEDTEGSPIQKWVEDYESGQEGDFQRHLNDAVISSQALNDTEREELRRVMFVYEEFYKSATAMLSRMTQLLEKIAGAIR